LFSTGDLKFQPSPKWYFIGLGCRFKFSVGFSLWKLWRGKLWRTNCGEQTVGSKLWRANCGEQTVERQTVESKLWRANCSEQTVERQTVERQTVERQT